MSSHFKGIKCYHNNYNFIGLNNSCVSRSNSNVVVRGARQFHSKIIYTCTVCNSKGFKQSTRMNKVYVYKFVKVQTESFSFH